MLRAAKASHAQITVETCPHYLHFAAEDIRDGATEFKCCPPVRERANREQQRITREERRYDEARLGKDDAEENRVHPKMILGDQLDEMPVEMQH